jgi:hypothetical protein
MTAPKAVESTFADDRSRIEEQIGEDIDFFSGGCAW